MNVCVRLCARECGGRYSKEGKESSAMLSKRLYLATRPTHSIHLFVCWSEANHTICTLEDREANESSCVCTCIVLISLHASVIQVRSNQILLTMCRMRDFIYKLQLSE